MKDNIDQIITKEVYKKVLEKNKLTEKQIKMIKINYYSENETITATKMAEAMGWICFSAANLHYGKIGTLFYDKLGFYGTHIMPLNLIVRFEKPDNEWHWILREEFILALIDLEILEPKKISET